MDVHKLKMSRDLYIFTFLSASSHIWYSSGCPDLLLRNPCDTSPGTWSLWCDILQVGEISTGQPIIRISMNRRNPRLCLVSFSNTAPAQLDFGEERSQTLPFLQMGEPYQNRSRKWGRPCTSKRRHWDFHFKTSYIALSLSSMTQSSSQAWHLDCRFFKSSMIAYLASLM